jgi:hypothetical protein
VGSQFHHSHVSRGPPIIPDGRVSQVRFEVLACHQCAFPNRHRAQALVRIHSMTIWFAHCFVPSPGYGLVCPVLSSRARACRRDHQAPSAPLPDVGVTFVRETYPASCGDITPRSSLLRAHVPIPCGSPLLRFFTSFEESLQVATSPCCHRDLLDVILRVFPWLPGPLPRRSSGACAC